MSCAATPVMMPTHLAHPASIGGHALRVKRSTPNPIG
jgi:hypothetical protein